MTAIAACIALHTDSMILQSDLLGSIDIESSQVFNFPTGLFGFPDMHEFALLPAEHDGLYWLQSTEHSALAFVLADPFTFFDDYTVDLGEPELRELGDPDRSNLLILAVVTLPRSRNEPPTANLQGPIAVNLRDRLARQVPISESEHGLRSPFSFPGQ